MVQINVTAPYPSRRGSRRRRSQARVEIWSRSSLLLVLLTELQRPEHFPGAGDLDFDAVVIILCHQAARMFLRRRNPPLAQAARPALRAARCVAQRREMGGDQGIL
jgi:hypothetical protein